ncbi:acyl-CoA dehydrogenase [Jatrophihabitans cynanchi]|uniref:Acyl-CoA dehydrogenase n=1 Tax=Jatrophihabitans cynanchi TaxID=2944128 RepID=A0ABY7JXJ2_9ACTN|nr:acyl-CoA dehydrogenase [Jatrophihabitans sp. SB3-54]WAX56368.1 acyl-CoA dehydrogenase [Jatrophihabitans sp. SB3-54]
MSIGLSEEHRALRDAVRGWASRHVPPSAVRAAVEAKDEILPPFWPSLADQGLLALHLPEEHGGAGQSLLDAAVALEELGRALVPGPVLPTLLASAVLHDCGHATHLRALADGSATGAFALQPGGLTLRDGVLDGISGPVSGAAVADVLVLAARDGAAATDGAALRWVVLARDQVEVEQTGSYDLTCRPATVRATGVRAEVLPLDEARATTLAAVLFAAEASGLADWCVTTACGYARVREQFGRPIGQFQGVKHRCARMLARAEQARAAAWDAARAAAAPGAEAELAAAVAGLLAPDAAFSNAKDCVQVLGGIGFTWEHDAGLYLRRAHSLRLLLGSSASWQQRVAKPAIAGVRRNLGVELPGHAERIRAEVRAELQAAAALDGAERDTYLAEHGYTAPHLPAPWGKGADALTQLVIAEELRAASLRPVDMVIGGWVVPTLIAHGSAGQQKRFLPASLRGDIVWCQLFSEPGAGSDLAALSTRAVKVEGGWRLSGQKVWTSMAREAHWGICLARTDPDGPKHKGISYFIVDMHSPGVDVRPLRELTGEALFNEVFLDDVFVPDDLLVGEPGDGWKLARTTLANERVALSYDSSIGSGGERLLAIAAQLGGLDAEQLCTLGTLLADAQAGGLLALRTTLRSLAGGQPGAESSIGKLLGAEHTQLVWQTAMDWLGPDALTLDLADRTSAAHRFLNARCLTIAGGTTEVQLNIIAERLLGLPRDPEPVSGAKA